MLPNGASTPLRIALALIFSLTGRGTDSFLLAGRGEG